MAYTNLPHMHNGELFEDTHVNAIIDNMDQNHEDIQTIQQTLTSVAQQGDDPDANISDIQRAMVPIANEYAQGKQAIVDKMRAAGLDIPANASLVQLYEKLNEYTVLIPNGVKFIENSTISELGEVLLAYNVASLRTQISVLKSDKALNITSALTAFSNLKRVELPNASCSVNTIIATSNATVECFIMHNYTGQYYSDAHGVTNNTLKCLDVRNNTKGMGAMFSITYFGSSYMNALRHLYGTSFNSEVSNGNTAHTPRLYDYRPKNTGASADFTRLDISTALSSNDNTLCDHDEWDDPNEPQEGFSNNREKYLWYFEYHFIPCFPDVTAEVVITLPASIYNVISGAYSREQPTKTLLELLTDNGWTVASA